MFGYFRRNPDVREISSRPFQRSPGSIPNRSPLKSYAAVRFDWFELQKLTRFHCACCWRIPGFESLYRLEESDNRIRQIGHVTLTLKSVSCLGMT